ncbi:hypothetical protein V501_05521 [Pseudogymnoascus sp. VKM F-4519 (FW-2642)]|nr:hypothetical protein V501_05521 [Pseudogymnoascus sp. VKM F-4519 (FW-2642)]
MAPLPSEVPPPHRRAASNAAVAPPWLRQCTDSVQRPYALPTPAAAAVPHLPLPPAPTSVKRSTPSQKQ